MKRTKSLPPISAENLRSPSDVEVSTNSICGNIKADGTTCNLPAGHKTTHPGTGLCIYCSTQGDDNVSFMSLSSLDKLDSSLGKSIRDASNLPDVILYGQDVLLRILWGLLDFQLKDNHRAFTPGDLLVVSELIGKILSLQRGKQVIEKTKNDLEERIDAFIRSHIKAMMDAGIDSDTIKKVFNAARSFDPKLKISDEEIELSDGHKQIS